MIFILGLFSPLFCVASKELDNPKVILKTSKGDITIELYPKKAPLTVENFLSYVDEGFFDGTIFHRVGKGFMIQGGALTSDLQEKPTKPPIKNEAPNGLKNTKGTIAMARTDEVNSATSQFFINLVDNPDLDYRNNTQEGYGYAVFAKVTKGMEVVETIANVPVKTRGWNKNFPQDITTIISVRRLENK